MGLTQDVAAWSANLRLEDVPAEVQHLCKRHILDSLGTALAGSALPGSRIAREVRALVGGQPQATVLGTGEKVAVTQAAFANGNSGHGLDYDDTQLSTTPDRVYGLLTHPSVPVLSAALAVAEWKGASGAELLAAFAVGVEVACKVAEAINPRHYQDGFHSTATMGTHGAAMAAARLLGLDAERTAVCFGIAASTSAGLRENFGTMMKPFHAGRAAENGVLAALFAERGFTAAPNILEAGRGFFKAAGGGYDASRIESKLGNPWTFTWPGISIKPYPSGSLTHPAIDAAIDLVKAHDLRPEQVERITVGTNSNMPNALIHHRPSDELQAKFSMEFCMAAALRRRRAGLEEFTDEYVLRPEVQELIGRVEFGTDPEMEARGYDKMWARIRFFLKDGRVLKTENDFARGSPQKPLSDEELAEKFRECARVVADGPEVEATVRAVMALERQASARDLPVFGIVSRDR